MIDAFAVQVGHYPRYNLREIGEAGFNCVKFVLMPDKPDWKLDNFISDLRAHGLKGWGIVAGESVRDYPTYATAAMHYASTAAQQLEYLSVGNENDGVASENPASWCISIDQCNSLLREFEFAFRSRNGMTLCAIGTVRGDGEYVRRLLEMYPAALDGYILDVHAYAQDPGSVAGMLSNYGDRPKVVGEYGTQEPDLTRRGQYVRDMAIRFSLIGVRAASVYCWDKTQGEDFYVNDPLSLPAIRQLRYAPSTAVPRLPTIPPVVEPSTPAHFVLGFAKWAALEADRIGTALRDERTVAAEWQIQPTSNGILSWVAGKGHAFVSRDGRVFRWREEWAQSQEVL